MRTNNKTDKNCYRSHAFYVDKTNVSKFESSQGGPFLSHKNKEQQVRAPVNENLFNQTFNSSISKNYNDGYRMSVW